MTGKSITALAGFVTCVSLALNVVQGRRIVELQKVIESGVRPDGIVTGTQLHELRTRDGQGREFTMRFGSSKPTVIYAFSPSCGWCQRNAQGFNSLAAKASDRYTFIGLALNSQGLQRFIAQHEMKVPVYEAVEAPGFSSTPQTLVISPGGNVLAVWAGAFRGRTKMQIERFFGVHLPDQSL